MGRSLTTVTTVTYNLHNLPALECANARGREQPKLVGVKVLLLLLPQLVQLRRLLGRDALIGSRAEDTLATLQNRVPRLDLHLPD